VDYTGGFGVNVVIAFKVIHDLAKAHYWMQR
jgi:hypothetical protein